MKFKVHHKRVTESTNRDARAGSPGDVYTASEQTAGRGRLSHQWFSSPGLNLMMSVVLDVEGLDPVQVSTFPLMVGLAVRDALLRFLPNGAEERRAGQRAKGAPPPRVLLKWPNDVLVDGRKLAGILCERNGEAVIAGIGVNVNQVEFVPEIADRATSLARLRGEGGIVSVDMVRDAVLEALDRRYQDWRAKGFVAMHADYYAVDALAGKQIAVKQTDDDAEPVRGQCRGVLPDGTLLVADRQIYAGEAHILDC